MTKSRAISVLTRAIHNYIVQQPLCVSFEVTHCCNARCKHCHLGGQVDEHRASPERLGEICRELNPVVAQLSGGEPLLRRDLEDIVRAVRRPNRAPYIDITTNGALLTTERYQSLIEAGVDQIGVSLDYPDDRHDSFRGVPSLFGRIEKLVNSLDEQRDKAITLICVIQRGNFRELVRMVELANDWKVKVNFSAYTWLRTGDKGCVPTAGEIEELMAVIARVLELGRKYGNVFTSRYIFSNIAKFFQSQTSPNCRTGVRFLNVNPDGTMSPCGLIIKGYSSQQELRGSFSSNNSCTHCYTSIRANTEKPIGHLLPDIIRRWNRY